MRHPGVAIGTWSIGGAHITTQAQKGCDLRTQRNDADSPIRRTGSKKPYQKPAFRYERVFETMALTCGKAQVTQSACYYNRKLS
jgi:hypothetical protein